MLKESRTGMGQILPINLDSRACESDDIELIAFTLKVPFLSSKTGQDRKSFHLLWKSPE